ncbi:hypothetical protein AK812_SmicGene15985 [Symbiodinium microadriaticum]|uniref:Ubiquitin-like domain-containing protein n=1 Tax=Symbiodinium microadriaticum TaxID=2951 RepID=A0A1Q9E1J2_SYMMI|nr:hypothetical protein AK812_SmicGene15985 [Symbiodinium microadriaticum]
MVMDARAGPTKRASKAFAAIRGDVKRKALTLHLYGWGLSSEYLRMLAAARPAKRRESLPPNLVELKLNLRCSSIKDDDVAILAKALPTQLKELKLDFTCCGGITDTGLAKLAEQLDFGETAAAWFQLIVYISLAETGVSKAVQEWYEQEAAKNEANGQSGQLKNVPASKGSGEVITDDADNRAVVAQMNAVACMEFTKAALRALNSFGEKAFVVGAVVWHQATTLRVIMSISVDVHLLSGKSASLEVEADVSVESLKQRAQSALGAGRGRLLNSSGEVLDGAQSVAEAKLMSGDVLTVHVKQDYGGDSSAVQDQLRDVQQIQASYGAFAATLGDGSVVSWGNADEGGDSSAVQDQLRDVQQIQASNAAFAAILGDGSVVTWGDAVRGADSSEVREQLKNVQQIQASYGAFAAILGDGSVVTWGSARLFGGFGGDSRAVQDQLKNVQQIQASDGAFAAILGDGTVVSWGNADEGGDSSAVQDQLRDVQQIQASSEAFAAILGDGSVVTWGDAYFGGDSRGGVSESSETIVPAAPAVMEEGIEGNELESDRKAKQPKHK